MTKGQSSYLSAGCIVLKKIEDEYFVLLIFQKWDEKTSGWVLPKGTIESRYSRCGPQAYCHPVAHEQRRVLPAQEGMTAGLAFLSKGSRFWTGVPDKF